MKKIILLLSITAILSSCSLITLVQPKLPPTHTVDTGDFSIIVLPDTQNEVQNHPNVFMSQIDWIVKNQRNLNIQAVVHVGDQVNVANDEKQWKTFDTGIRKLDTINMPVLLSLGNHDHPSTLYDKYFPISRYSNRAWWGGQMGKDTDNKYLLLTLNNQEYILINIDYCPNKDEIRWANEILATYPERKGLLATHAYLDKDGGRKPHICTNTEYIWNDLIKLHKNLQLVVSGHVHAESRRTDTNLAGNPVYQMLADFQEEDYGGNGWLRILTFKGSQDKIQVTTYSPFLQKFQQDADSQFELDYPL